MVGAVDFGYSVRNRGGTESSLSETASDDTSFAKQVDIGGGRKLDLVCSGMVHAGQPTIVLISGYHDNPTPGSRLDGSLLPEAVGPPVLLRFGVPIACAPMIAREHCVTLPGCP